MCVEDQYESQAGGVERIVYMRGGVVKVKMFIKINILLVFSSMKTPKLLVTLSFEDS